MDAMCTGCKGSGLARSPIREQVIAFHKKFVPDQGIGEGPPHVPSDEMVRFRLMILFEEAFELLDACTCDTENYKADRRFYESVRTNVGSLLNIRMIDVDIVEVADALADLDSVSEGMRLAFGIDGRPIADEVFRSNSSKTAPAEGAHKLVKGDGYFKPDVEGQLKKQGWTP
jgi:predicted HAD superfamily Cof-like phosphohydrolase